MSYQSKKRKKLKLNQLKYKIGLVWNKFFNRIKKKERTMRQFQTRKMMDFLREKNKTIRRNNPKINGWVDGYLDECLTDGRPVNILTQWCLAKDLEMRFEKQGGRFVPTRKERRLFEKEMPEIITAFSENGFRINWWVTLNRSFVDMGRIDKGLEAQYQEMMENLIEESSLGDSVMLLGWEDDILGKRPKPSKEVLDNFEEYIPQRAFEIVLEKFIEWAENDANLKQSKEELEKTVKFKIACEAEEGRLLTGKQSPLGSGNFLLIPLEMPERYDLFGIFADNFKKRIVSVVSYYPWRMR